MKVIKFEGTPEEFKVVAELFNDSATPTHQASNEIEAEKEREVMFDPKEAIRIMLKRRPVSDGQKAVYKALADGELHYSEFQKKTGRNPDELAGVLGALGRRINETKEIHKAGLSGSVSAVIKYTQLDDGSYNVKLTPDAEEVLRAEGII